MTRASFRASVFRVVPAVSLLSLLAACVVAGHGDTALASAVTDTLPGGIPRVMSGGPTEWTDTSGWHFTLERTIQPGENSPHVLGNIYGMALHPDGRLVIRDLQPTQLRLFLPDDSIPKMIAREGDGPGEVRQPVFALLGDTLIVHDTRQWRVSAIRLDGTFLTTFPFSTGHSGPPISVDRQGRVRIVAPRPGGPFTTQWLRVDLTGRRIDSMPMPVAVAPTVWERSENGGISRYNVPFSAGTVVLPLADGRVVYGRTDRDEFLVTTTASDTVRLFGRSGATPAPVSPAAADSIFAWYDSMPQMHGIARRSDIPAVHPLWTTLSEDGAGNIWVRREATGDQTSFDVYAADGRYRGMVAGPATRGYQWSWAGDRVAILDNDDQDLPRIRVYRITRN